MQFLVICRPAEGRAGLAGQAGRHAGGGGSE